MSADNWTVCPKCHAEFQTAITKEQQRVAALYGTVPVAEFDAARAALQVLEAAPPSETLREDYEIGIYHGKLDVTYSAGCACGFRFEFKQEAPVFATAAPPERQP